MEQNRVLMIIVSVAIFFAAIVGVGVALLYPRSGDTNIVAEGGTAPEFDPIEYVRRPDQAPLIEAEGEDPVIIVYGEREETTSAPESTTTEAENDVVTIDPTPPAIESNAEVTEPRETAPPAQIESTPPVEDTAPAVAATTTTTTTTTPQPPRSLQETKPEPRRIHVTEYWIQLIASPNRDRVEQVQGILADYSLGGRVTTRDIDGEVYYRLRVGPYKNKDEAKKFLSWIQGIEGLESAYVSEEYPLRMVNG